MVFNSLDYLFFFAIVTLLYYLIPQRKRYILLLVAGCIFYMCWNVGNIIVLLYIIVITYTAGQLLDRSFTTKSKKMICALTGLFSFGVLFLYKYLDFFIKNLSIILNKFGMEINYSPLELILPIGISFFIFQALLHNPTLKPSAHPSCCRFCFVLLCPALSCPALSCPALSR